MLTLTLRYRLLLSYRYEKQAQGEDFMSYKVKEVATLAGVSVRTLHHYDEIGLLKPASITAAGYRFYTDSDLERLQQILFFKELDFNLQEIKGILDSPSFDREHALKLHKELLVKKKKRLEEIIKSVDKTMASIKGGIDMNKKDMFESFDMSEIERQQQKYAEETKEQYSSSDAYKESQRRTSKYNKEDWARIMQRGSKNYIRLASLMDSKSPSDLEVQEVIADCRQYITDSFYNCTPEIFRGLADLYVMDERFTANIDKTKPGLAKFLSEGIIIYCENLQK
jgi:DNA-binding transcriptional MerR regulator